MNDEPKTKEDDWSVEPPKRDHRRLKKALRVALFVAALGVLTAAGFVLFGGSLVKRFLPQPTIFPRPHKVVVETVDSEMTCAEDYGQSISGAEDGD